MSVSVCECVVVWCIVSLASECGVGISTATNAVCIIFFLCVSAFHCLTQIFALLYSTAAQNVTSIESEKLNEIGYLMCQITYVQEFGI